MAYTTIDKPTDYFNTVLYTGNGGSTQAITGVGFQPDWVWVKSRSDTEQHALWDSVRGGSKRLISDSTGAEYDNTTQGIQSFDSDGFTAGDSDQYNKSSQNVASWNWLAGGNAPTQTYTVKVVSDSGNKYRFDDFGTSAVTLDLQEGGTYTFDQSDSSNSGHPLRFSTTSDGSHGGGSEYTTNVTTTGTPGSSGAKTVITVASGAATLYYYCTQHSGMGGQANTNSTFGSSNFLGSIQANVSANTTAGLSGTVQWNVYHVGTGTGGYLRIDGNNAFSSNSGFFGTAPTSTVFSPGSHSYMSGSGNDNIAYCFADVKGYSKFGSYVGNGSSDGPMIWTGFKPAWFMVKKSSASGDSWVIIDNKRFPHNYVDKFIYADESDGESGSAERLDLLSNGIKIRATHTFINTSGATYIFMAFAESPFVTGASAIPTTAR